MSIQAEIKNLQERVAVLETLVDANLSAETSKAWSQAVDEAGEIGAMGQDEQETKTVRKRK